jgi:hypothetical protein
MAGGSREDWQGTTGGLIDMGRNGRRGGRRWRLVGSGNVPGMFLEREPLIPLANPTEASVPARLPELPIALRATTQE